MTAAFATAEGFAKATPFLSMAIDAYERWSETSSNPNLDWTEKAARITLTISVDAALSLADTITVGATTPYTAVIKVGLNETFDQVFESLKRGSSWLYDLYTPETQMQTVVFKRGGARRPPLQEEREVKTLNRTSFKKGK